MPQLRATALVASADGSNVSGEWNASRSQMELPEDVERPGLSASAPFEASQNPQYSEIDLLQLVARHLFVRGLLPSLLCPMTHEVRHDPVVACDGYTYGKDAIEQYFACAKGGPLFSPMTGRILVSKQLLPNMVLRQQIRHHLAHLPLPKAKVSTFARVGMYQLELILSFLDARSLAIGSAVNASFFAVGSQPQLWSPLLEAEFYGAVGHVRP